MYNIFIVAYNNFMKTNNFFKWVNMIAFGVLMLGGLDFLLMGLFNFNLFGAIFADSIVARVIYGLFGLATLVLLTTILWRAFGPKKDITVKATIPSAQKATAPAKSATKNA